MQAAAHGFPNALAVQLIAKAIAAFCGLLFHIGKDVAPLAVVVILRYRLIGTTVSCQPILVFRRNRDPGSRFSIAAR